VTPPLQMRSNMPIIQTQLATPVQANRSYHTEQSSARRDSLENGQKDEQAPREPQGRRTSIDRVDEGLEAAANETVPHARRGSGDDKDKDTARDDEKRTLWLGDLVSLAPWTQQNRLAVDLPAAAFSQEPWMDDNYMRQTCLLMSWKVESIKVGWLSSHSICAGSVEPIVDRFPFSAHPRAQRHRYGASRRSSSSQRRLLLHYLSCG
jgi:hypothetical protein